MSEHAAVRWKGGGAFDALAVIWHAPSRAQLGVEVWMRSMKPASRRRGQAGSMPRALRFQEDRVMIADLFGSTALVLSER